MVHHKPANASLPADSRYLKRWRAYLVINLPLVAMGIIVHEILINLPLVALGTMGFVYASLMVTKNVLLLYGVDRATRTRRDITPRFLASTDKVTTTMTTTSPELLLASVLKYSVVETATYFIALRFRFIDGPEIWPIEQSMVLKPAAAAMQSFMLHHPNKINNSTSTSTITSTDINISYNPFPFFFSGALFWWKFILLSVAFEVIFDFFHYWSHRIIHIWPTLYRTIHAAHHRHTNPTVFQTFDDSAIGHFLTNLIPHLITLNILSVALGHSLGHRPYIFLLMYKTFVEVSGHSGKDVGRASSFPQLKWLPSWLGVALYTQDHHLHHRNGKVNFGKRFVLWDVLFRTYQGSRDDGSLPKVD